MTTTENETIEMPEPTAIPFFVSVAMAMMGVGIMTSLLISLAGLVILLAMIAKWSGIIAHGAGEIEVPLVPPDMRAKKVLPSTRKIAQAEVGHPSHRGVYPIRVRPYRHGLVAGAIGGCVMAVVAMTWGLFSGYGIWFPVNLLGSIILTDLGDQPIETLGVFHQQSLPDFVRHAHHDFGAGRIRIQRLTADAASFTDRLGWHFDTADVVRGDLRRVGFIESRSGCQDRLAMVLGFTSRLRIDGRKSDRDDGCETCPQTRKRRGDTVNVIDRFVCAALLVLLVLSDRLRQARPC